MKKKLVADSTGSFVTTWSDGIGTGGIDDPYNTLIKKGLAESMKSQELYPYS